MQGRIRRERLLRSVVPVTLAVFMTAFITLPLIHMFGNMDAQSLKDVLCDESLPTVIGRSIAASGVTTVISLLLALLLAFCLERTNMRGKKLFRILAVLPMLIPSISIGMGVVMLFGNNGLISRMLNLPIGNIYGMKGIVLGSVLYSFPVAFLMVDNILKYEDAAAYEAADVLGIGAWRKFTKITIPYLKKPMIVVAFSVFSLSFTDYGVPLMVGGKFKTLPVLMYQEVIGRLNFGKGCVYGSMLLIPAIVAFVADLKKPGQKNSVFVIKTVKSGKKPVRDLLATILSCIIALFGILPIFAFVILAFVKKYPSDMAFTWNNITKTMQMGGGKYLLNSLVIALLVSCIGVAFAVIVAYCTARTRTKLARYLHLVGMSMAAVPGVVLGLAFVLFFRETPLYGTLAILVVVNTVHFFASAYVMIYTAFSKINDNLEAVASTLGIGRVRLLVHVLLPKCRRTLAEMFASFFVNSMMTISAVSFLANSETRPIALMINQFEAQAQMECAAVVSLAILLANLMVKILLEWIPTRGEE